MPSTYGSSTSATISLTSLAISTDAESTAIDNTSTKYDQMYVLLSAKPGGTVRTGGHIDIGLLVSLDGTNYATLPSNVTSITSMVTNTKNVHMVTMTNLPPYFKIIVQNRCGSPLSGTGGDNTVNFIGVNL